MKKVTKQAAKEELSSVFKAPWLLAFRYIGSRVEQYLPYFKDLGSSLQKAGLKITLQSYVSLTLFITAISFVGALGTTVAIATVLAVPIFLTILFAMAASILSAALVFGILYGLPAFLVTSRRKHIDLELPYVTSHLSILAAAGIPPARMFKLLEDSSTTPQMASEANEIVRDVEVLGDDIITALEHERARSPSRTLAEILEGLVATIRSGGNLKNYLLGATRNMMELRRIAAKQLVEGLASFAEIYVTLMVVFPLLLIVMFSVIALIGGGLAGFSVTTMMALVTYGIIPLCAAGAMVLLDSMLVED
jgi:flagellar protein FlaJ